jgi:hypothetical protein
LQSRRRVCAILDLASAVRRGADAYVAAGELARWRFEDPTFVAHSGAGALIPSMLAAANQPEARVILADGLLPHPGRSWLDTAPPRPTDTILANMLDGMIAPWPGWIGPVLADLLPRESDRDTLKTEAPAVSLAYLETLAPPLDIPAKTPCAYLRLSAAYEPECGVCEAKGWPVSRLDGHHLWLITEPTLVADAVLRLDDQLRQPPRT